MRPDDIGDLRVVVDVTEDPLADLGVLFHLPALLERQGPGLLEQTSGETDLADVMYEATEVDELLFLSRQSHSLRDVSRIDRHRGRVTRGVLISGVERRYQSGREGEARPAKPFIGRREVPGYDFLLLIEVEKALCRK